MNRERIIYILSIAALVVVLMLQRECTPSHDNPTYITDTDTITLVETVEKTVKVPTPTIVKKLVYRDTIYLTRIDTITIVENWLDSFIIEQEISDTNLTAWITDTLTQNLVAGRGFRYKFNKEFTTIITNEIVAARNKFYIGGLVQSGINNFGISPAVALNTRRDHLYMLSSNLLAPQPNAGVALFWKLNLRKKQ